MTTTPQAALLSAQNPLLKRCYTMSESHLSGYRVVIGFERLEDAQDAHEYIAKLQATQKPVQAGSASLLDGCKSIMDSIAVSSSVIEHNKQAEPVQAGELPALPHDGWPARFRCDSCDGNGEIGELISMGHFQPPERQTCPDCGGRGWSDEGPAFNADHMRDYARAALSARKPLSYDLICNAIDLADTESMKADYMLDSNDCIAVVRTMQALIEINGIGLEVKP